MSFLGTSIGRSTFFGLAIQELADQVFQHYRGLGGGHHVALGQVVLVGTRLDADVLVAQQAAGQDLERTVIKSDVSNSRKGLWFGLVIGLAGISAGTFLAYSGHTIVGTIFGGGTIVSLVGVFVYGSQGRKSERGQNKERAKELESSN